MKNLFLTNYSKISFLDQIKESLRQCKAFYFSVSFIKKAGLVLIEKELQEALERGACGRIITSTYQNFTDIDSLNTFLNWTQKYDNLECHLDFECFGENGYHTKGYLFELDDKVQIIVGSSNITRYALKNNIEWNVSLISKESLETYDSAMTEFESLWENTLVLDEKLIDLYRFKLDYAIEKWDMDYVSTDTLAVNPNAMQRKALREIRRYRDIGVDKALIISATGSGKTYLAAFDARNYNAQRLLYIVHRDVILKDARDTFKSVFRNEHTYGLYNGDRKDLDCDFVFASTRMLSMHLDEFDPKEFEYIVYDEVHHIVADSGLKIFKYFKPDFMLGLTATPERMDNKDVFGLFDQNIPYELRLRDAILNDLVVPFHYFGIRDKLADYSIKDRIKVAKEIAKADNVDFISSEIKKHKLSGEKLKCLAFCTNISHCKQMAEALVESGYNAEALTGSNDTGQRIRAFKNLQDDKHPLEIICAVDILNEGVDIPQVNMVLFLRPTESQTVFLQQLGRGLRKYPGKDYVTVLDFIGNNYERSVQIALALGTLGKTVYTEKSYLKALISSDYANLAIPGVEINIDSLSKEEIIHYIDSTNFNRAEFLKKDYENFKKYINSETYPSHMDYLNSDVAPDLMRFIKSKIKSKKNKSYYSFLKKVKEEAVPVFSEDEITVLDSIEELLPLVRVDEYIILRQLLTEGKLNIVALEGLYPNVTVSSLEHAVSILKKKGILDSPIDLYSAKGELKKYLLGAIEYGLTRYDMEFGEFEGNYKLYANYYSEQITTVINRDGVWQLGTYFNVIEKGDTFVFAGLKKDEIGKLNYKDKFISPTVFQWESKNNTTIGNSEGKKLLATKKVFLFVRKMKTEDGITLPFTFFGTGKLTNMRESYTEEDGKQLPTLLFDIVLDHRVPEDYHLDFEIIDDGKAINRLGL